MDKAYSRLQQIISEGRGGTSTSECRLLIAGEGYITAIRKAIFFSLFDHLPCGHRYFDLQKLIKYKIQMFPLWKLNFKNEIILVFGVILQTKSNSTPALLLD